MCSIGGMAYNQGGITDKPDYICTAIDLTSTAVVPHQNWGYADTRNRNCIPPIWLTSQGLKPLSQSSVVKLGMGRPGSGVWVWVWSMGYGVWGIGYGVYGVGVHGVVLPL